MTGTTELEILTAAAEAEDTSGLAAVLALKVYLIAQNFTPGPLTDKTALTAPTFTGSAAKTAGAAPHTLGRDPVSGRQKIIINEPVGGWTWNCTVPAAGPETIYGLCLTDNAGTTTYASALLPAPVTVSAAGDLVSFGEVSLLLASGPWS